ncbi:MAG: glycoside hydrolase family 3 C-terminal domain-containing protein [Phycisphaerales bacterium]|nr:glycoside hydrolase family 3 C-terminal domain-containing protein [Phycisphaerales bacterium]
MMSLRCVVRPVAYLMLLATVGVFFSSCKTVAPEEGFRPCYPFEDTSLSMDARAEDLVRRMTLEEKIGQLQMNAPAIERLGVPAYHWWNESLHGVARNGVATVFPQAIGMAATWNTTLHYRVAQAIGLEARAKHHEAVRQGKQGMNTGLDLWAPNINIFRDPRWGRGQETYGEDPYLAGRFGVAFVKGLQGEDSEEGGYLQTIATPKHFAVHSGPEMDRHRFDSQVSEEDLWEAYLPAFEACVREGKAYSVMGAYNRLNGTPCCANEQLLGEILRKQWGFQGYVVSDVGAMEDICASHQYADSMERAAAMAVKAGCDLNGGAAYGDLLGAVKMGMIQEREIDIAVKRVMLARLKLGMFDPQEKVRYAQTPWSMNDSREHEELSRQVARESIVLLQNRGGILPLRKDIKTIAVIGPTANSVDALVGSYNGTPGRPVTIVQGVRNAVAAGTRVIYAAGSPLVEEQLPLEEVVPGAFLFTDESLSRPGLRADYYKGLVGRQFVTRNDATIDFNWSLQSARNVMPLEELFSARWTGVLVPPETGEYQIGISGKDAFRLFVDGKKVVEDWATGPRRSVGGKVRLEKGKAYAIAAEYCHVKDEAAVQLRWTRPGGAAFYAEVVQAAEKADAVVMVLGLTAGLEREQETSAYAGFQGGDRQSLDLPRVQQELLEAVCATGKPVVLVMTSGSALSVNWAKEHVAGIVHAWYPGEQGGNAVADVLFGDYNPAGRLPVTFYKSVSDLPAFEDYAMRGGQGRTYRYFRGEPLWPFGFGLSYAKFEYDEVEVPEQVRTGEDVQVRVTVRNASNVAGDEVVQLYVRRDGAGPMRSLQGFARVALKAGEAKTVVFTLTPRQLAIVNEKGEAWEETGKVTVQVGGSSVGGIDKTLRVEGERVRTEYRYVPPK